MINVIRINFLYWKNYVEKEVGVDHRMQRSLKAVVSGDKVIARISKNEVRWIFWEFFFEFFLEML